MDEIIKELQKLGLSQYECKAYINLLKNSPVTGYGVKKTMPVLFRLANVPSLVLMPCTPNNTSVHFSSTLFA